MAKKTKNSFLTLENTEQDLCFQTGDTLLDCLVKNEIEISHSCGGMGSCGTCRIFIIEGNEKLGLRSEEETLRAEDLSFQDNERLSCQILAVSKLKILIP